MLRRAWTRGIDVHLHEHGDGTHHVHVHGHASSGDRHDHGHRSTGRALAMGTLHGLAGSASFIMLALPQSRSTVEAMAYLSIFGIGSIAGMLAFSVAISFPLRMASRTGRAMMGLEAVLGSTTVLVGMRILSI